MASKLESSTKKVRKVILISLFILFVIILFNLFRKILLKNPEEICNPFPQKAENEFGKIPEIKFSSKEFVKGNKFSYKIDTNNGKLATTYPFANVYKQIKPKQSFKTNDQALSIANLLKFTSKPISNGTILTWNENGRTLLIDQLYKKIEYHIDTRTLESSSFKIDKNLTPDQMFEYVKDYLSLIDFISNDYSNATYNLTYLNFNNGGYLKTDKLNAKAVKIRLFRQVDSLTLNFSNKCTAKEINEYKLKTVPLKVDSFDDNSDALVFIISLNKEGYQIIDIYYSERIFGKGSVYSILDVNKAFEKISKDEGTLILFTDENGNDLEKNEVVQSFLIRESTLFYTLTKNSEFLVPFYKFSGIALTSSNNKAKFEIIINALTDDQIEKNKEIGPQI